MNGVRVNRERVVESVLKAGDEISVADVPFTFRVEEPRSPRTERDLVEDDRGRSAPADNSAPEGDADPGSADPEPEDVNPSRTYSDEHDLENEVREKHDSESEAGFVRV